MDPQCEKYERWSGYNYVLDNPLRNIDPKGDTVRIDPNATSQFRKDYEVARNLLHEKGQDKEIIQLENSTAVYTITETDETNDKFGQNTDAQNNDLPGGTIKWNPTLGVETNTGAKLSPTTLLNHEFDHAAGYDSDAKDHYQNFERLEGNGNSPYGNREEERVITGSEQRTARALGEIQPGQVTRVDHKYRTLLFVPSPTSNQGSSEMFRAYLPPVQVSVKKITVNPQKNNN